MAALARELWDALCAVRPTDAGATHAALAVQLEDELARALRAAADPQPLGELAARLGGDELSAALRREASGLYPIAAKVRAFAKNCGAAEIVRRPRSARPAEYSELRL